MTDPIKPSLAPMLRLRVGTAIQQARRVFREYTRHGVLFGHDALQANNTAAMLHAGELIDMRNVFEIFSVIVEAESEIGLDVDVNHPTIASNKAFTDYKRSIEQLKTLLGEGKTSAEALKQLLDLQIRALDAASQAISGPQPKR